MREVMRRIFDEMWIIDLEGDNLGTRKSENVFAIQTPVAIATGVRYEGPKASDPATIHYCRIDGTQDQKYETLSRIRKFNDLTWRACLSGWSDPLLPRSENPYWDWPLLTDCSHGRKTE